MTQHAHGVIWIKFMRLEFDSASPARLYAKGYGLFLDRETDFKTSFEVEPPCVVQGPLFTDNPFRMGAFSISGGGFLRCIDIGRYCSLAGGIDTGRDDHPIDWVSTSMMGYVPDVHGWATFLGKNDRTPPLRFARAYPPGCYVIGFLRKSSKNCFALNGGDSACLTSPCTV